MLSRNGCQRGWSCKPFTVVYLQGMFPGTTYLTQQLCYQFISVMYQATEYGVVWALTQAHKFIAVSLLLHIGQA